MSALPKKECFKCGEVKCLSLFYKHPGMSDGHLNKCKECNKNDVRTNRRKKRDYYNAYDRVRNINGKPHSKNIPGRKQTLDTKRNFARTSVGNALRDGKLSKLPCWTCGEKNVQGHHPDYDSPLDVIWLCPKHHGEVHREYDHEQDKIFLEKVRATFRKTENE